MTRAKSLDELNSILTDLNADELQVLARFAIKIANGAKKHGPMDLDADCRDWEKEIRDELTDASCYGHMRDIQSERRRDRAATEQIVAPRTLTDPVAAIRELQLDESGAVECEGLPCPDCVAGRAGF